MGTFMQNNLVAMALAPDADRYDSDPATDVYNMKDYDEITFIVVEGAGGTGTATITVEECDDVTPTNSTAIAFDYKTATTANTTATWSGWTAATTAGVTPAAAAQKMTAVRVRASSLSAGYPYVRLVLTEDTDGAVDAAVVAILSDCRNKKDVLPDPTT